MLIMSFVRRSIIFSNYNKTQLHTNTVHINLQLLPLLAASAVTAPAVPATYGHSIRCKGALTQKMPVELQ